MQRRSATPLAPEPAHPTPHGSETLSLELRAPTEDDIVSEVYYVLDNGDHVVVDAEDYTYALPATVAGTVGVRAVDG